MKILHVTTHFHPFIGGLENMVFDLAKAQSKKNEVVILTLQYDKSLAKEEKTEGIKLYRVPCFEVFKNQYAWPKFGFSKKLNEINPDVIFTHTRFFATSFFAQKNAKNCKKIHVEHGQNFVKSKNIFIKIFARIFDQILGKFILRKANKIVVLSMEGRNFVEKLSGQKNNISIISNGVKIPKKIKKIPKKNKAIFFGRIIKEKGIEELLEAAKKCPNWKFNIYGKSNEVQKFQNSKVPNIYFRGEIVPQKISEKIQESDLVILPSWSEGNSLAILEAAANARAIIATPVGQNQVIVLPDLIVPVGDEVILSQKLKDLEGRWEILESEGQKNLEKVKKLYSFDEMIKAYDQLI